MVSVLLIAPTCDGTDVGESWVAFQWARELARTHQVTLLTYHKRGRPTARSQLPGVRVIEWTEPPILGRFERFNSLLKPAYPWFYWKARRWVNRAVRAGLRFDIVHQPTPVAMRYPCPAIGFGIPVIIGPIGGALDAPPSFMADDGTSPFYTKLRALDHWRLRHDPWMKRTYSQAACILGIAPYVRENLAGISVQRFEVLSETGLLAVPEPVDRSGRLPPTRLLYVGRLVRTKGARDLIRAMARLRDCDVLLDIAGDGPDRSACEALVKELELTDRVTFHGHLSRPSVDNLYRSADLFAFPSYREPGGNVVPEAMSFGLPVIVVERGGPGAATDDQCAIRLPLSTPEALAADLAIAIRSLLADPDRLSSMGRAGRERVFRDGLWSSKITYIERLYASVTRLPTEPHQRAPLS